MSGTSCDGIDAALVELRGAGAGLRAREIGAITIAYRPAVRRRLLGAVGLSTSDLASLHFALGRELGRAALRLLDRLGVDPRSVDFVGSHGHTVYHGPRDEVPSTLQIGHPALIAAATGITTIGDFRAADVAAGGEGAPLTPHVNRLLFSRRGRRRAIHNLGGISNLTALDGGAIAVAFDTGPGNMLIDAVVREATQGRRSFDEDGRLAAAGRVSERLLAELLEDRFFRQPPPKSTGRERFGETYAVRFGRRARALRLSPADRAATATALTARSIERAYRELVLPRLRVDEIFLTGGGARNPTLVAMLRSRLDFARVDTVEALGFSVDSLEAVSFAALGLEALAGRAADLRSVTGSRRPAILGAIHPGRNWDRLRRRLGARR
jgi:anhydro-N-acetylmuramic acid kinase